MHFEKFDIAQGITIKSKRRATRDLIARVQAAPLEDTAMKVDESILDDEGFLTPAIFEWQERPAPHSRHNVERELLEELEKPSIELDSCHDAPFKIKVMFKGPHEEAATAKVECDCGRRLAMLDREIDEGKARWRWKSI